ncbi:hypothetical protein F4780DRAFT_781072 [Xylariomycetidae sp. FL0641]|nr:hypothetical protein F4780DRAFT_781072 [Xylariomycetidae sp. FL0641]
MVKLSTVRAANAELAKSRSSYVAVVAGGTAGIGECAVRALAATFAGHGARLRVYIVGRNRRAADQITSACASVCPGGRFRFVQADLVRLREVDRGVLSFSMQDGPEGIDRTQSLFYFSRMRFAADLLPWLGRAPGGGGGGGRVVAVLNAGGAGESAAGRPADDATAGDAGLRRRVRAPGRAGRRVRSWGSWRRGATPARSPAATGPLEMEWVLGPLTWPLAVPLEEVGQRLLYMASARFPAAGEQRRGSGEGGKHGGERHRWHGADKIWDATMKVFEDVAATGACKE